MDLQFVFGNPIKKKSSKKSIVKTKKVKKTIGKSHKLKQEVLVAKKKKKATKKTKKVAKKAAKKSSKKSAKKSTKRVSVKAKAKARKGGKKRGAKRARPVTKELVALAKVVASGKKASAKAHKKASKKRKTRKKRSQKRSGAKINIQVTHFARKGKKTVGRASAKYPRKSTIKKGEVVLETLREVSAVSKNRKTKKQITKVAKKVAKKVKSQKDKAYAAKMRLLLMKKAMKADGSSVKTIKRFTNPFGGLMKFDLNKYLGHDIKSIGGLAAGGAVYGAVNGLTSQYAKPVHDILTKVPVVGTAMPSLIVGILLNAIADKVKAAAPLAILGQGLVGASVVGMGVNAAQMIPALKTMAGADFGSLQHEASLMGDADFGSADFGHGGQMGAIDYTMNGIDYTMNGVDYTAEMDGVPEGMGSGQMG